MKGRFALCLSFFNELFPLNQSSFFKLVATIYKYYFDERECFLLDDVKKKIKRVVPQKQAKKKNIAVFVDGPNILRKELDINLEDVTKALQKFGNIKIGKVFLNQYASNKLVEACVNQGFESIITVGDVDVTMAVEALESVFNPAVDVIAMVTRDSDFLPSIVKAKRYGKETIVVLAEEASAIALKNTADHIIILGKNVWVGLKWICRLEKRF